MIIMLHGMIILWSGMIIMLSRRIFKKRNYCRPWLLNYLLFSMCSLRRPSPFQRPPRTLFNALLCYMIWHHSSLSSKIFLLFEPFFRIWLQSLQKVLIWPQKNFFDKNQKRYPAIGYNNFNNLVRQTLWGCLIKF